jgi:diguanylate cyclase (GGDEF)-like protein
MRFTDAVCMAEKLRNAIEARPIVLDNGRTVRVTASFGVSTLKEGDDRHALLAEADEMLYQAKADRNTVMPEPRILDGYCEPFREAVC